MEQITKAQRITLIGLLTLAKKHVEQLGAIECAINEMVGGNDSGHVTDSLYGHDIDDPVNAVAVLLGKMDISVKEDV